MKEITIEDKELINSYRTDSILNSEYQFTTLFAWAEKYKFRFVVHNGFLLVFGTQNNGNMQCYFPIGNGDLSECFQYIKEVFYQEVKPFNLRPISDTMLESLKPLLPNNCIIGTKESYSDYLYAYDDLLYYNGSAYKKKRKLVNQFYKNYEFEYEKISAENALECLGAIRKIAEESGNFDIDEWNAYTRLFKHYSILNLKGIAIRINKQIEGVTVGELCNEMVLLHIRRCNKKIQGIYPAILQLLLKTQFAESKCQFVNGQDDMGILSLRCSKLSYKPKLVLEKTFE